MNQNAARLTLMTVLSGMLLLMMSYYWFDMDLVLRVFRHNQLLTTRNMAVRRYSTSDEMRYILYGDGNQLSGYDQQLVDFIRSHISQPSAARPRQLAKPHNKDRSQAGQSVFVDKLLARRQHGFFVECGAFDGESLSNSLFFETQRNWTGLLIEANPNYHRSLLNKNRRAYVLRTCLSSERRPITVRMLSAGVLSAISDNMHPSHLTAIGSLKKKTQVEINCFPLNMIMAALNISHIDYLSLDVEGSELGVLSTVDWKRLYVDVLTVEYRVYGGGKQRINEPATLKKLNDLRQFFHDTGIYQQATVLDLRQFFRDTGIYQQITVLALRQFFHDTGIYQQVTVLDLS